MKLAVITLMVVALVGLSQGRIAQAKFSKDYHEFRTLWELVLFLRSNSYVNIFFGDNQKDYLAYKGFYLLRKVSIANEMEGRDYINVFINTSRNTSLVDKLNIYE